jgi:hypothetical protein
MTSSKVQVYWVAEGDPDEYGVVRYSGDPDEFTAAAHAWLAKRRPSFDGVMAVLPPQPRYYRWVPGGEYGLTLHEAKPGRGAWLGAILRVTRIGCALCYRLGGAHADDCLNANVTALATLQFGGTRATGPLSETWIHAVRSKGRRPGLIGGTPGPTLCDIERFAPDTPGWSIGGGSYSPAKTYRGCYLCGKVARDQFPGVPISGARWAAEAFAATTGVPLIGWMSEQKTPQPA